MHRLKGYISLRPRRRFLTTVPLFPMEKPIIYLPGTTVWAKYSSQGIYKANKTHSRLSAEERYSNSRLPRRLSNPGLLHRRVEGKHSANAGPPTMVRFHHKLGEIHSGSHSVINIPGPLHKLCDNDAQPPREKDPEHTKQMPKDPIQPHFIGTRSGKPDRDIGGGSPCNLAGPPPLQVLANTAHKIPTGISTQLRDAHVIEQQRSGRTALVVPERTDHKWQSYQPSCSRSMHNF